MTDADALLAAAAKRGSMDALGALFDRHWLRVWRAAYAVTGQRELANDAAQETFLRAFSALRRFDHRRPIEPWLVRIAVNRAIDLVRTQPRLGDATELADSAREAPPTDAGLLDALRRLSPERRTVIALHYWFDYTTPEIAEALGVPLGTIASRLSRALEELRHELEAENV